MIHGSGNAAARPGDPASSCRRRAAPRPRLAALSDLQAPESCMLCPRWSETPRHAGCAGLALTEIEQVLCQPTGWELKEPRAGPTRCHRRTRRGPRICQTAASRASAKRSASPPSCLKFSPWADAADTTEAVANGVRRVPVRRAARATAAVLRTPWSRLCRRH